MLNGLKIKCVGFSVTGYGDPCYPILMENCFKANGDNVKVSYSAVGGLSIDALPYLLKIFVKKDEVDLVILEIATSWFSLHRTCQEQANEYIKMIVDYLESIQVKIMFLNLYRKDLNDCDSVVRAISSVTNKKYPILDFKSHYRRYLLEINDDGTADGVHPKLETIEYVSAETCKFIKNNIDLFKVYPSQRKVEFDLITVGTASQVHHFDNGHGLVLPLTKLEHGEVIEIEFPQEKKISGIFFMWGPDTNQVNLTLDSTVINIPMRDKMSFYRRAGYLDFGTRAVKKITIEHPIDAIDVEFLREPWETVDKLQNYILGFSSST